MKDMLARPDPSSSGAVQGCYPPKLGDGLCDVLKSPSTCPSTSVDEFSTNPPSLTSGPTPHTSTATTPISSTRSPGSNLFSSANKHVGEHNVDEGGQKNHSSDPQHCGPSPLLDQFVSTQWQPQTQPTHTPEVGSSLAGGLSADEIIAFVCSGQLSLSTAVGIAEQCQFWDLLAVIRQYCDLQKQPLPHLHIDQVLQLKTPISTGQPTECSAQESPIETARDCFSLKLMRHIDMDQITTSGSETNLHVFVDMSNIFIGFCDSYKISKGIPLRRRISFPYFSFKVLSIVMERGRNVQKRVLAGSTSSGSAKNPRSHWPYYFLEAENSGYTMNIFSRVQKRKSTPNKLKHSDTTSPDYHHDESPYHSVDGIAEEPMASTCSIRKGEQGVDENLHLNMMNSMWDYMASPGTIVLATGDAAEAEFSGGFLEYAIRALNKGWKLELITWRCAVSSSWTNRDFIRRYSNQFRVIFLDDFLEELQNKDIIPSGPILSSRSS